MNDGHAITRRNVWQGAATVAMLAAMPRLAGAADIADTIMVPTQAPGFYRFSVGEVKATVVTDGHVILPPGAFGVNEVPETAAKALVEGGIDPARLIGQINVLVLETNGKTVLVDTGAAGQFQPTTGRLPGSLKAAGFDPAKIDVVAFTHAHLDHVAGFTSAGAKAFPNAELVLTAPEHAFWMAPDRLSGAPEGFRPFVMAAQQAITGAGAQVRLLADGAELVPGIRAMLTPGHTPGHTAFLVSSGDQSLAVIGDVVHNSLLSLAHPDWHFVFDADPTLAVTTRQKVLDMLATDRLRTFAYHLDWPGLGRVVRRGDAFAWTHEDLVWSL